MTREPLALDELRQVRNDLLSEPRVARSNGHSILLLGCRLKLPTELEHEITPVDFSLPDNSQFGVVWSLRDLKKGI